MNKSFEKIKLSPNLMSSIKAQADKEGITVDEFAAKILSSALARSGEEITLEELVSNADDVIDELIKKSKVSGIKRDN